MGLARLLRLVHRRRSRLCRPRTLLVGLGNVGPEYDGTRHNVGFDLVDRLAGTLLDTLETRYSHSVVIAGSIPGVGHVALVKPTTLMNRSGAAVRELLEVFGLEPADCLVAVDDFNLDLGTLRFRRGGSAGGHNGLKSIIEAVGDGFPRLRLGIGPLPRGVGVVDYVLGRFEQAEAQHKERMIAIAAEAVVYYCRSGIAAAMNAYN